MSSGSSRTHCVWRERAGRPGSRTTGGAASVTVSHIERAPLRATLPQARGKLGPGERFSVAALLAGEGRLTWGRLFGDAPSSVLLSGGLSPGAATRRVLEGGVPSRDLPACDLSGRVPLRGDVPALLLPTGLPTGGSSSEDLPGERPDLLTGPRGQPLLAARAGPPVPLAAT